MASALDPADLAELTALLPSEEAQVREAFYKAGPGGGFGGVVTASHVPQFAALFGVSRAVVEATASEFDPEYRKDVAASTSGGAVDPAPAIARLCGARPHGSVDTTLSLPAVCGFLGMVKAVVVLQSTEAVEDSASAFDARRPHRRRRRKPLFARLMDLCSDIAPSTVGSGGVDRDALAATCAEIGIAFPPQQHRLTRTHELKAFRPQHADSGIAGADVSLTGFGFSQTVAGFTAMGGDDGQSTLGGGGDDGVHPSRPSGFRSVGAKRVKSRPDLNEGRRKSDGDGNDNDDGGGDADPTHLQHGRLRRDSATLIAQQRHDPPASVPLSADDFRHFFGGEKDAPEAVDEPPTTAGALSAFYAATAAGLDSDGDDASGYSDGVASDAYSASSSDDGVLSSVANRTTNTDPRAGGGGGLSSASNVISADPPELSSARGGAGAAAHGSFVSVVGARRATLAVAGRIADLAAAKAKLRDHSASVHVQPSNNDNNTVTTVIAPEAHISRRFAQALKAPLPGPQLRAGGGGGGGSVAARRRLERQVASEPCTDPKQALRLKQLAAQLRRSGVPDTGDRLGKPYRNAFSLPSDASVIDRAPVMHQARAESPLAAYMTTASASPVDQQQQQQQRRASSASLRRAVSSPGARRDSGFFAPRGGGVVSPEADPYTVSPTTDPFGSGVGLGRRRQSAHLAQQQQHGSTGAGGLRLAETHDDERGTASPFSFIGASAVPSTNGGSSDGGASPAAHSRLGGIHSLDPGARLVQLRRRLRSLESEKRGMVKAGGDKGKSMRGHL